MVNITRLSAGKNEPPEHLITRIHCRYYVYKDIMRGAVHEGLNIPWSMDLNLQSSLVK